MTARAAAGRCVPRRRLLGLSLLVPLLLAACSDTPPPPTDFPPLVYDYLSKLRLTVATIDIDNAFARLDTADPAHVEAMAPVQPAETLRRMAQDRLIPAGSSGHAVFVIEDASLMQMPGGFQGAMHVRLDVSTSDGAKGGFAEAQVSRTYTTTDTSDAGTRAALYDLVKLMMRDMNVEFEYQVKHQLRDDLQPGDQIAPAPPPVQTQDLNTGAPVPPTDQTQPAPPADQTQPVPPADQTQPVPPADQTQPAPPADQTQPVPSPQ